MSDDSKVPRSEAAHPSLEYLERFTEQAEKAGADYVSVRTPKMRGLLTEHRHLMSLVVQRPADAAPVEPTFRRLARNAVAGFVDGDDERYERAIESVQAACHEAYERGRRRESAWNGGEK